MHYEAGTFSGGQPTVSALNAEFKRIEQALPNYVSRTASVGNSMEEALDMNDHEILNVATATSDASAVNLAQVKEMLGLGVNVDELINLVDSNTANVAILFQRNQQTQGSADQALQGVNQNAINLSNLAQELGELDSTISSVQVDIEGFRSSVDATNAAVGTTLAGIDALQEDVSSINSTLGVNDLVIRQLERDRDDHETRITELENNPGGSGTDLTEVAEVLDDHDQRLIDLESVDPSDDSQEFTVIWSTAQAGFISNSGGTAEQSTTETDVGNTITLRWGPGDTATSEVFGQTPVGDVNLVADFDGDRYRWLIQNADGDTIQPGTFEPGDAQDFKVLIKASPGVVGLVRQIHLGSVTDRIAALEAAPAQGPFNDDTGPEATLRPLAFSFGGILPDTTEVARYTAVDTFDILASDAYEHQGTFMTVNGADINEDVVFEIRLNDSVPVGTATFFAQSRSAIFDILDFTLVNPGDNITIHTTQVHGMTNPSLTIMTEVIPV